MLRFTSEGVRLIHKAIGVGFWIGAAGSGVLAFVVVGGAEPSMQGMMLLIAGAFILSESVLGFLFFAGKFLGSSSGGKDQKDGAGGC